MVNLSIHSTKVRLKTKWEEITLEEAIALYKVADGIPAHVVELYREKLGKEPNEKKCKKLLSKITMEEHQKTLPSLYGEMLSVLSDIDKSVLDKMWPAERRAIYDQYLAPLVLGLLFFPAFDYKAVRSFKFEGVEYYLPNAKSLYGVEVPGADVTALEFTESADLQIAAAKMEEGKLANAAKIIAILCRPKGEPYNEIRCGRRAEKFAKLPMNVVWGVFFSLLDCTHILSQSTLLSTLEAEVARARGLKSRTTDGTPRSSRSPRRGLWGILRRSRKATYTIL